MNLAEQYIEDVLNDRITVNRYARLAVNRHMELLANAKRKGYYFDRHAAQRVLDFFGILRFTKGKEFAGKPFKLSPWQAFILWVVFGWKVEATGYRLISKCYVEVAKKNGKTELAAGIASYMFLMDEEPGAEVYVAATKKAQARICFDAIRQMMRYLRKDSAMIRKAVKVENHKILKEDNSKIEPLGQDSDTDQGINTHCGIIDEYWAHKTSEVLGNIQSSMVSRPQPLLFIITTAGFNLESPCFKLRQSSIDILEGDAQDDSFFAMIFSFDEGDDWEDRNNWYKPIPNLGVSVRLDNIEKEYIRAKNEGPIEEKRFKTLNLNMWHASSSEAWIEAEKWNACQGSYTAESLAGRKCFGGIDMAATSDIAAFVTLFPGVERAIITKHQNTVIDAENGEREAALYQMQLIDNEFNNFDLNWSRDKLNAEIRRIKEKYPKHRIIARSYYPRMALEEKAGRKNNYLTWLDDGWITPIESNVIASPAGLQTITDDVVSVAHNYELIAVGYDEWNAYTLASMLQERGIPDDRLFPYRMGYKSMSPPMRTLYSWVMEGDIEHDGNPVLSWMIRNIQVQTDGINIKPDKRDRERKIDAVVALIIAVGQYMIWESENKFFTSIYENPALWQE